MSAKLSLVILALSSLVVLANCTRSSETGAPQGGAYSDLNSNYRTDGFADPRSR